MTNLFSVPDKEKNYQGYMVYVLSIIWSVVTGLVVSLGFFYFPNIWPRWLTYLSISVFIAVFNLVLNRFGYTRVASWSLTITLWLYITIPCYSAGGILAPGILSQMSVILTAGFLLGWGGGLAIGLLTIAADFGLAYLEMTGHLPAPSVVHNPMTRWIGAIIPFGTILALQYYATNHLNTGLIALQREILRRREAERIKDQTVYNLGERVKELEALYEVSRILRDEDAPGRKMFCQIAEAASKGWQYPDVTAANISIAGTAYATPNYKPSQYRQHAEMKTAKGTSVGIEIVYLQPMPDADEGPFLKEERNLINMLAEMLKIDLEHRERTAELKDYKYALDISSIVGISKMDGSFSFVNENFCKASKYSAEELLGSQHSILWSGHTPPEYFTELGIALQDGKPYRAEFCNKAKDGSLYWVDATIVPFLDEERNVYQYISINHDITEQKEASEKLRASEERYRSIITVSNTGAWEYDHNTGSVWYSTQYFAMLGLERPDGVWDDTLDATWVKRLHPEDRERSVKLFDDFLKGGSMGLYESFFRMRHENGDWVWIWSRARRLLDKNGNLTDITLGTHIDISERIKAEEKIKQSEQLLKKITSQVPGNTYMFEIEENGFVKILFMSRGTDPFNHSYNMEDPGVNAQTVVEMVHDDDKAKFNDAMKEAYRTQAMTSFQYRVVTNGTTRWRWMQAVPEKVEDGNIVWYGATSDITALVDYIVSIEQITFDIGHVIRRPISSMLGMTKLIIDNEFGEKEIKEISHTLYSISEEMDNFIGELNLAYNEKRANTKLNIDVSSSIDKRSNLFTLGAEMAKR